MVAEFATSGTGIRDEGIILYRWVLYLHDPAAIDPTNLPTCRSPATTRLSAHWKRKAAAFSANSRKAYDALRQARSRGSGTAEAEAQRRLQRLQDEAAAPFDDTLIINGASGSWNAAAAGGGGGGGGDGGNAAATAWFDATAALSSRPSPWAYTRAWAREARFR